MSTHPRNASSSMVGPGTSMHLPARSGHGSPTMDPHGMHQQQQFQQTLHGPRSGDPSPTMHQSALSGHGEGGAMETPTRKPKGPSVRKACVACHTGKTRCSESLPCQSCVKRGIAATCAYPDPSEQGTTNGGGSNQTSPQQGPPTTLNPAVLSQGVISKEPTFQVTLGPTAAGPSTSFSTPYGGAQYYTDTHGRFTGASSSSFRPAKRVREEEEDGGQDPAPPPPPPPPPPQPPKGRTLTDGEAGTLAHPGGGMPGWTRGDIFVGNSAPVRVDTRLPVKLVLGEGGLVHFIVGE